MPAVPTKDVAVVPEPKPEEDVLAWLKAYIPSDSFKRLPDWLKLAILGSILEAARRGVVFCWNFIQDACFLSVHFDGGDDSYEWMMTWLARQPSFQKSRDIEVSTSAYCTLVPGEDPDPKDEDQKPLKLIPAPNTTYTMWFQARWMRVYRTKTETGNGYYRNTEEGLHLRILSRDPRILARLLLEAKRAWGEDREAGVSVHIADQDNDWRCIATRPKRPIRSIILDEGVKDMLLEDARDFLGSKKWYAERGIPFRRGYLLHGQPGSGKTSLIHSIAGELDLDVYIVSLSRSGLDDNGLSNLIGQLPARCIALMEDIDAAFKSGITRDADSSPSPQPASPTDDDDKKDDAPRPSASAAGAPVSKVTLSGLLNALDGIGAQEGRILFATTNRYGALDSALTRPGRMDLHVEFRNASSEQAEGLYRYFYLPSDEDADADAGAAAGAGSGEARRAAEEDEVREKEAVVKVETVEAARPLIDLDASDEKSTPGSEIPPLYASLAPPPAVPEKALAQFLGLSHTARAPRLSRDQYFALAREFGRAIPDGEFSMASLQGYLMAYKIRPFEAVRNVREWIEKERSERVRKEKR